MIDIKRIDGIIWDFDGVIRRYKDLNTSLPIFHRAAVTAFNIVATRNNIQHDISEEEAYRKAELSFIERKLSMAVFYQDHGVDRREMHIETHRQLMLERHNIMSDIPGLREALMRMRSIPNIIVTQASCEWVTANLKDMGLQHVFHQTVIGHETSNFDNKFDNANPFLLGSEILGIAPPRLGVVEDSMSNLRIPYQQLGAQTALITNNGAGAPYTHGDKEISPFVDEAFETPLEFIQKFEIA